MRTPAQNATLALLLEVAGTPKPGNVDRHHDFSDLRFEHFLAGALGAQAGLQLAEAEAVVGPAFERAVEGMAAQRGGNTQFGALLLLVPLVCAAREDLSRATAESVARETTVADAAAFYRSFEHVDVFVPDPPDGLEELDVRRDDEVVPTLEERELTLQDVLDRSAARDDVAREWVRGFERSFAAAEHLAKATGSALDRAATTFLALLADRPDTLVANQHGADVAHAVADRAAALRERNALETDPQAVESFADELVDRGINPGTTADLTAAGLFIALEREAIAV